MHYHLEIVLPPTKEGQVEDAVATILRPFDENNDDASYPFWDWWVIGGRWSGQKAIAGLDPDKIDAFEKELQGRKFTVSGIQAGKPELNPDDQVAEVDELWRSRFPESAFASCPLFGHAGKRLDGDVMKLGDVPNNVMCERAILAIPSYVRGKGYCGPLEAQEMWQKSVWNGVSLVKTEWSGGLFSFLESSLPSHRCSAEWQEVATPTPEWLVVTVDYHS